MSATSGGSVSEGSEAGESSRSTVSVNDSPPVSFQPKHIGDNVTKITLTMDESAAEGGSGVTGSRIVLTESADECDRTAEGIVNMAFDGEDQVNASQIDFRSNNESEGKIKSAEAVNLELVNMVPYNNGNGTNYGIPVSGIPGIPVKKDVEQGEMGTPYDEYFVPVNEHKKFMRGEKLYVTKDKRRPPSWKRCLSWSVACIVITVVIILAILAGTGVILNQEPSLVKEASIGRNFGGGANLGPVSEVTGKSSITPPPSLITDSVSSPTTDLSYIRVPRSIETELIIDNLGYNPKLDEKNSSEYQTFTADLEEKLKMALFDYQTLNFGASNIGLKVLNVSQSPMKIKFRVGWTFKQGIHNPPDAITVEEVKQKLTNKLMTNNGFLDTYHINPNSIKVRHVMNLCQFNKGGCSHECNYDYGITQEFVCSCPAPLVLDHTLKSCIDLNELPHDFNKDELNSKSEVEPSPEPSAEPSAEPSPEPAAEPSPEPAAEPSPEPAAEPSPEPAAEPSPEPAAEPSPEPAAEPSPEPAAEPSPEPAAEPSPEPAAEPSPEPEAEPSPEPAAEPSPEPAAEPSPEPAAEPSPEPEAEPSPEPAAEPSPEPAAEPSPEPAAEPSPEPAAEPSPEPAAEPSPEPAAEPSPEPAPEPSPEPSAEPSAEPSPEPAAEPSPEPSAEPSAEPSPELERERLAELSLVHEHSAEPSPEASTELPVKSKAEQVSGASEEPNLKKATELKTESEPLSESTVKSDISQDTYSLDSADYRPAMEFGTHDVSLEQATEEERRIQSEFSNLAEDETFQAELDSGLLKNYKMDEVKSVANDTSGHGFDNVMRFNWQINESPKMEAELNTGTNSVISDNFTHNSYMENDKAKDGLDSTDEERAPKEEFTGRGFGQMMPFQKGSDLSLEAEGVTEWEMPKGVNDGEMGNTETKTGSHDFFAQMNLGREESSASLSDTDVQKVKSKESVQDLEPENHGMAISNSGATEGIKTIDNISHEDGVAENDDHSIMKGFTENSTEVSPGDPGERQKSFSEDSRKFGSYVELGTELPTTDGTSEMNLMKTDRQQSVQSKSYHDLRVTEMMPDMEKDILGAIEDHALGQNRTEKVIDMKGEIENQNKTEMTESQTERNEIPDQTEIAVNGDGLENYIKQSTPNETHLEDHEETAKQTIPQTTERMEMLAESSKTDPESDQSNTEGIPAEQPETTTQAAINREFEHLSTMQIHTADMSTTATESSKLAEETVAHINETSVTDSGNPASVEGKEEMLTTKSVDEDNQLHVSNRGTIGDGLSTESSGNKPQQYFTTESLKYVKEGFDDETENERFNTLLGDEYEGKDTSKDTLVNKYKNKDWKKSKGDKTYKESVKTLDGYEMRGNGDDLGMEPSSGHTTLPSTFQQDTENEGEPRPTEYKHPDSKETDSKLDKEYSKYDKDLKHDKLKVSKKKDIKKKGGAKDGKNVELDDKYLSEIAGKLDKKYNEESTMKPEAALKSESVTQVPVYSVFENEDQPEATILPDHFTAPVPADSEIFGSSKAIPTSNEESKIDPERVESEAEAVTAVSEKEISKSAASTSESTLTTVIGGLEQKIEEVIPEGRQPEVTSTTIENAEKFDEKEADDDRLPEVRSHFGLRDSNFHNFSDNLEEEFPRDRIMVSGVRFPSFEISPDKSKDKAAGAEIKIYNSTVRLYSDGDGKVLNSSIDTPETGTINSTLNMLLYENGNNFNWSFGFGPRNETKEGAGSLLGHVGNATSFRYYSGDLPPHVNVSGTPDIVGGNGREENNYSNVIYYDASGNAIDPKAVHSSFGAGGTARPGETDRRNLSKIIYHYFDGKTVEPAEGNFGLSDGGREWKENSNRGKFSSVTYYDSNGRIVDPATLNVSLFDRGNLSQIAHRGGGFAANFSAALPPNATSGIVNRFISASPTFAVGNSTFRVYSNRNGVNNLTAPDVEGKIFTSPEGHPSIRIGNSTVRIFSDENGKYFAFDGNPTFKLGNVTYRIYSKGNRTGASENGLTTGSAPSSASTSDVKHTFSDNFSNLKQQPVTGSSIRDESIQRHHLVDMFLNVRANDSTETSAERMMTKAHRIIPVTEIVYEHYNETDGFDSFLSGHDKMVNYTTRIATFENNPQFFFKCAAGQFQCINGTSRRGSACVSLSSKCDSINDCSDGSDEIDCIENGCPGNFQCSDGTCLKRHLVCNGIVDCNDGSDEKNCENWKCEFDEFQCPSGRCIPVVWQCDSKPDCDNHTDEQNCQTSCGNDEFFCPEGWCIPLTYKCNGVRECSNGEDEQFCDCSLNEFKCEAGGCVPKSEICDGIDHCPDRSDERNCIKLEEGSNLLQIRTTDSKYQPVCSDGWTAHFSDVVCASLGYASFANMKEVPMTDGKFFALRINSTDVSDTGYKNLLVNLVNSNETCTSGKFVELTCQQFSCGSRSMTEGGIAGRLAGGINTVSGQWPSIALLFNTRNPQSCTANILTPRWALASYSCLKMGNKNLNEQDWKLFSGSTVFEAEKENVEARRVNSIIPHPQVKFNQFLYSNDVALVELNKPLILAENVGAVCLPEAEIQPRQICVTAGWGMNTPGEGIMKQHLQYLPIPTMDLQTCNSTDHYSGFISNDKICAGYTASDKSLCYNEEGAPLMCVNDRGEWELHGVLSYHSNCGRGSHPSIFSSISSVRDWIESTIGTKYERNHSVRR